MTSGLKIWQNGPNHQYYYNLHLFPSYKHFPSISLDINLLYERRRQLYMLFREQQTAYQAAYQEERRLREEEERKRRENRQALKVEKFKRRL